MYRKCEGRGRLLVTAAIWISDKKNHIPVIMNNFKDDVMDAFPDINRVLVQ
jgi:hypothetical protein